MLTCVLYLMNSYHFLFLSVSIPPVHLGSLLNLFNEKLKKNSLLQPVLKHTFEQAKKKKTFHINESVDINSNNLVYWNEKQKKNFSETKKKQPYNEYAIKFCLKIFNLFRWKKNTENLFSFPRVSSFHSCVFFCARDIQSYLYSNLTTNQYFLINQTQLRGSDLNP